MAKTQPKAPQGLSQDGLVQIYKDMLVARLLDERMWTLNRIGKAPFVISCQGQEASQVGWSAALRPDDVVVPYYRDLGVAIQRGMTVGELMLAFFGKEGDPNSNGRQMPGHFGCKRLNMVSGSSVVIVQMLHAVGVAYAMKMRGQDRVAAVAFGEGSTAGGDFHEALNWASIYRLPVLFVCENNGYAISVPQHREMAIENVSDRAGAYDMAGVTVDGNDVLAVYEAALEAVERGRRGEGATLLELKTYRVVPHSSDDDDRVYRSREEVEAWKGRDPIARYRQTLTEMGLWDEGRDQAFRTETQSEIEAAVTAAEAAPFPDAKDALRFVYAEEGQN
jgi:2-oxoisovalerate dehydrogenase E1 component alpha subunit